MYLIIGLGNPGEEFRATRHNIGRETVLAARNKFGFKDFAFNSKLNALLSEGKMGKEKIALVLPQSFMNKSGQAVGPAVRLYKTKLESLVVIHDDADILVGSAKLSFGKNSGGHKGVESVMRALKTKNFWRMRIGIQRKKRVPGENLVLQKFRSDETTPVKKIIKKSLQAIENIAILGPERAMNELNCQTPHLFSRKGAG